MAEKLDGAVVAKGHEEGIKLAISMLNEFGLPLGLLPLADVIEVSFVRSTGYMRILQKKKVELNWKQKKNQIWKTKFFEIFMTLVETIC